MCGGCQPDAGGALSAAILLSRLSIHVGITPDGLGYQDSVHVLSQDTGENEAQAGDIFTVCS